MNNRISIFFVGLMLLQLLLPSLAVPIQAVSTIPGLTIGKTASKSVVEVGETFTYTIDYNVGDSSRNGIEITIVDTIPSQFEIVSGNWTARNGQTLTFGPESLTFGTAGQFNIEVKAKPTGVSSAVQTTNTATVTVVDTNETTTVSANVTINPKPNIIPNNGTIGDYVWRDINDNGIQDGGEVPIPGVVVKLYNSTKQLITETTTDNLGYYMFDGLEQGTYYVQFIVPTGYKFTKSKATTPDRDSNAIDSFGMTDAIEIGPQSWNDDTIDVGMVPLGSFGNYVWIDTNEDGIQDKGEPGINGVVVKLYDSGKNTVIDEMETTSKAGVPGYYKFENLSPGTYHAQFILPTGYRFTKPEVKGGDSGVDSNKTDSDGMTDAIVILPNQNLQTIDVGLIPPSSIGNYVWIDLDKDGVQDPKELGINGVTVKIHDSTKKVVATTTTANDANGRSGYYKFENLSQGTYFVQFIVPTGYRFTESEKGGNPAIDSNKVDSTGMTDAIVIKTGENIQSIDVGIVPTGIIGDYVWIDLDVDGIQDAVELGIAGVSVKLYNSANQFIDEMKTDADGYYKFEGLAQGTYYVQFIVPTGYRFTESEKGGNPAFDSNKVDTTGMTDAIVLGGPDEKLLSIDVGVIPTSGTIGDYVWIDTDEDGIQDVEESGIDGVHVKLFDSGKNAIATTTTANSGYYMFTDLAPGTYYVQFTAPTDYKFTESEKGGDSALDSNKINSTGMTDPIEIGPYENLQSIDVGLIPPSGTIGNYVWIDVNEDGIQGAGESGIDGVVVKLYDTTKQFITQTTTSDNAGQSGYYTFEGLAQGTYYVEFVIPKNYKFTKSEATTSDKDSNKVDGTGMTDAIVIGSQSWKNETIDVGMVAKRIPPGNSSESTQEAQFTDISGHWAEDAIKKALSDGIAKGYNDGTFRPDAKVTRAEFMVMLMNSKVLGTETIRGYRNKTFRPSASMSRLELEVMIARVARIDRDAAAKMIELGSVNGSSGNLFASDETITRAEAVTLIMNLIQTK